MGKEAEAIMGKDGSHENCSACGNGSYKRDKLIMCDYCPRVLHLRRCARLLTNYKGEYKCPKCEEEGNQKRTEGGEVHWEKITTKLARIKEKEGITLTIEEFLEVAPRDIRENETIKILRNPDIQFNPRTINRVVEAPEWSIKPRQIYEAQRIHTVERTRIWVKEAIRKSKQNTRLGTQNKIIIPVFDIIDDTYIWSWVEVNGETGEWIIGNIQHTEKELQRAKETREVLRRAIKEEQADTKNSNPNEKEITKEGKNKNKAELGIKMLQELEGHIEGKKEDKGDKNTTEIRRGMLHSQLIGEQMKGAQEFRADTMQKMKTIELTEEEKKEKEKARREIWETKIRKQKRIKETMEEMGWENQKLKGRKRKDEGKEQKTEQQGRKYTQKSNTRIMTGIKKEIKEEKVVRPKENIMDQRKREEEKEIKRKIEGAVEAWQTYFQEGEEGTEKEEKREKEVMNEIKNIKVIGHAAIEIYIKKGLEAEQKERDGETYALGEYTILDVNWGQYTEKRPGEVLKGKEAGKTLKEMMREKRKYIMVIHYSFHWSVVVIDNINKKINTYDSGVTISNHSHKEPNIKLKESMEDITGEQWNMEQIPVPQQDEGESCGYRMLSNLNKIVKGQEIHREEDKESNRLYYYLEIAQTLKDNQIKRSQNRKRKRGEEEKGEEELEQEEDREEQERQGKRGKKDDNTEKKKQKKRKQENNKQEAEGREERQKRQKTQKEEDDKTKEQKRGEQNQHKYSLRSGRFRVEDTQPD